MTTELGIALRGGTTVHYSLKEYYERQMLAEELSEVEDPESDSESPSPSPSPSPRAPPPALQPTSTIQDRLTGSTSAYIANAAIQASRAHHN